MSEFELYKSNGQSLKRLGIINRIIFIVISSVFPALLFLSMISNGKTKDLFRISLLSLWVISIIVLIVYSRYLKRHIEIIGVLALNTSVISKTIGGFEEQYEYSKIKCLVVKQHIRKIFLPPNADKSKTYLVTIEYEGKPKEQFVVSSLSSSKPKVNFLETIMRIEKYLNLQLLKPKQ